MILESFTVIESPYAGDVERNMAYLQQCILDCIERDESPYASHQMLTQALNDASPAERELGFAAGLGMSLELATRPTGRVAFYLDHGMSSGMLRAKEFYQNNGIQPEERWLYVG